MEKRDWGERGDFRKVTVTLPPEVYDALVQESARRKSAGDPNHLLSAIAREWFAQRQPLLPIERTELSIYRIVDRQRGERAILPVITQFAQQVGEDNDKIVAELVVNLATAGWLTVEKWSPDAGRLVALSHWKDIPTFFYQGENIQCKVTIPGRRRKEALEVKEQQAAAPAGTE
jgi:hypothetical protein